jgi:hypothetical protein
MAVRLVVLLELHVVIEEPVEAGFEGLAVSGALLELFVNVSIGDGDISLDPN